MQKRENLPMNAELKALKRLRRITGGKKKKKAMKLGVVETMKGLGRS